MAAPSDHTLHLNVKLIATTPADDAVKAIEGTPGVYRAEPLFPGESHPDLTKLYVVYLDESAAKVAVPMLRNLPEIEYVEVPEPRKLIRPRKKATPAAARSHP
jgi:hypothetical protein